MFVINFTWQVGEGKAWGFLYEVIMTNWSRNSYICDVLQLLTGNVAAGFCCVNIKENFYLWDRDVLEKFYTVV